MPTDTGSIALAILGILLGHPQMSNFDTGSGGELEDLDNTYDDLAYHRRWLPWDWKPGLCINCCSKLKALDDTSGARECHYCGWLQSDMS